MHFPAISIVARRSVYALLAAFLMTACPNKDMQEAIERGNEATEAYKANQFDDAILKFKEATEKYREHHPAWFGLGSAYFKRNDYANAADAFEHAVRLVDKEPMYHMWLGIALYEKAIKAAKTDMEKKGKQAGLDYATLNPDTAIQHLQKAVSINGKLWRAHYQLGRIFRDQEKGKEAAEAFTKAITLHPAVEDIYVALAELYSRWDYADEALKVALAGVQAIKAPEQRAIVEYELGKAYFEKHQDDRAIEAFSKALAGKKDMKLARFQRGATYFRKNDWANAKKDLDEFAKNAGAAAEFEKSQANRMLMDIMAKGQ